MAARIALCDDNSVILAFFDRKLKGAGFEITGKARDGNEGVNLFESTKPDLMLLDVTMPNKDGRECLATILKSHPNAKIVMVSALKDDALIKECLANGAKGFVSKSDIHSETGFNQVLGVINSVLKAA